MFEGYIASKFADKMFEKDIFRVVRNHALFGALIMMIPDFGFGTIFFIGVLWHMYSSICNKVGISFSEHFWSLVGVGVVVNIIVALAIDVIFSFFFILEGFIMYFQFYMSGKLFVESIKKLDIGDGVVETPQKELPKIEQPERMAPKEPVLDELRSSAKIDKVENTKIAILNNLNFLLYTEAITPEEFRRQKQSTLCVNSIPWDNNKSTYEILEEMKDLFDINALTQEEFDFHKNMLLSGKQSTTESRSLKDNLVKLDELLAAGILTEEEYDEQKKKMASTAIPSAKVENNKIAILTNLKLLLDSGIITSEEYRKQKSSTLSVASIPWANNKTSYEILEEMKSLLDANILTQSEFDFYKKTLDL